MGKFINTPVQNVAPTKASAAAWALGIALLLIWGFAQYTF
jgi:hypothetical protein